MRDFWLLFVSNHLTTPMQWCGRRHHKATNYEAKVSQVLKKLVTKGQSLMLKQISVKLRWLLKGELPSFNSSTCDGKSLARNESQDLILKAQPLFSNLVSDVTHRCVSTTWSLLRRAIDAIASRLGVTPAVNFEIVVDDGKGCCYPSPPPNPTHTETKKTKLETTEIKYGTASLNLSSGIRVLMLLLCTS